MLKRETTKLADTNSSDATGAAISKFSQLNGASINAISITIIDKETKTAAYQVPWCQLTVDNRRLSTGEVRGSEKEKGGVTRWKDF